MNKVISFTLLIIISYSCVSKQEKTNRDINTSMPDSLIGLITPEEYKTGWRPLFNGLNLDGWKGFLKQNQYPGWFVKDSLLITKGDSLTHPVDLISKDQFEDFELSIEWAICWQGNSGIFFHSLENSWAPWVMGPEYAIVDEANLDNVKDSHKSGANYDMDAPLLDCALPQGQFNHTRIKVKDAKVEHWLNGNKVVEYELWTDEWYNKVKTSKWKDYKQYGRPIKGSIGLQGHGFETMFRNIKIKDLTELGEPFMSVIYQNDWQTIGDGNWIINKDKITGTGNNTGIMGLVSNSLLNENFTLRFQLLPEKLDSFYIQFLSNIDLGIFTNNLKTDTAGIIVKENGIIISLFSIPETVVKIGEWNELILRRKGNQLLMWLNNDMVVENNLKKLPIDLNFFGVHLPGNTENKVTIKKMFFKQL